MPDRQPPSVLFLSWAIPWPPHSGAALRTLGLLKELGGRFPVNKVIFWRRPPNTEERSRLQSYVREIHWLPMRDMTALDRARILRLMITRRLPYHSALLAASLAREPELLQSIRSFQGVIFSNTAHWGTLIAGQAAPNWILSQFDADIDFWRVYASQTRQPFMKLAALINWRLANHLYTQIYPYVNTVISVCEEDRQLTQAVSPSANVIVVENGFDGDYYVPERQPRTGPPRLLFTGTSVPRNLTALHQFTARILPLIRDEQPDTELLVAGNFTEEAQRQFAGVTNVRFTGQVADIRPHFNISDVFVAPFADAHGSKLKVVEAMAMAMPIVATPHGIRGLRLERDEAVLVANDDASFARAVLDLLTDRERAARLGAAARRTALETLEWGVLGERLANVVSSIPLPVGQHMES